MALYGYAVIATDYAGLDVAKDASGKAIVHEYVTGPAQANDLLYSVPAAEQGFPTPSKEFVTMGHSEGGGPAWKRTHDWSSRNLSLGSFHKVP